MRCLLLLAALFTYSYFYQGGGWNQNSRFDLTRALVEQHSTQITAYADNSGDLALRGTAVYCDKAPGVSLLAVPWFTAWQAVHGPARDNNDRSLDAAAYIVTIGAVALPAALFVVVLFELLAIFAISSQVRLALCGSYAWATLAWPFSTMLYGHQVAASLGATAFLLLVKLRYGGTFAPAAPGIAPNQVAATAGAAATTQVVDAPRAGTIGHTARPIRLASTLVTVGALLSGAVVCDYTAGLFIPVLAIYAATFVRPLPRVAWVVVGAVVPALALGYYHYTSFGHPLTLPYEFSNQPPRSQGWFMGIGVPRPYAFWHLTLLPYRGLFFCAPWLLAAFPAAVLARRLRFGAERIVALTIFALFLWMNSSLVDWRAGWTFGPRYLVPAIPFLIIAMAASWAGIVRTWLTMRPWARRGVVGVTLAVLVWSFIHILIATAVNPQVAMDIRAPWSDFYWPHAWAGQFASSTQSITTDHADTTVVAWNLGQRLGLHGWLSLVPLLLVQCFTVIAALRLRRV